MPSNIQVFVKWKDQTIFAGENVECTITFKNVAETGADGIHGAEGGHQRKISRVANHTSNNSESFFSLNSPKNLFSSRRSASISSQKKAAHQRAASSLSSPLVGSHSFPPNSPSTPRSWQPGHSHKRSVSILSIDSEGQPEKPVPVHNLSSSRNRPARGHGRSASLQVAPKRNDSYDDSYRRGMNCYCTKVPLLLES